MTRRTFMLDMAILTAGNAFANNGFFDRQEAEFVYGHNEKKFTIDSKWMAQEKMRLPVKDCHEMVFTHQHQVVLLTNDVRNNVIFFDKKGKILKSWGNQFPGAHGLSIHGDQEQTLFITDTVLNQFFQTSLEGKILRTWDYPAETGKYSEKGKFVPTETTIAANGDIFVADGYGEQYILHYDADGRLRNIFGGRGDGDEHLDNAHGICIDNRSSAPTLIVTDRNRCCFKRFSMEGRYLEKIVIPGANVCRPVIHGDYLYAAVLTTDHTGNKDSGFVVILDKNNQLVSAIAGATPMYKEGLCSKMYQTVKLFKHPHDVLVDDESNLYVCQWNSGQVYPIKLKSYA